MKDPAILFYTSDFLTGTIYLNFEERGKFIYLLCTMHQHGRLSEETIRLLVGSISVNLSKKFKIDDDNMWYNERLEAEAEKRANFTLSRRNNGKQGGRPKNKEPIGNLMVNHMDNLMPNHMGSLFLGLPPCFPLFLRESVKFALFSASASNLSLYHKPSLSTLNFFVRLTEIEPTNNLMVSSDNLPC